MRSFPASASDLPYGKTLPGGIAESAQELAANGDLHDREYLPRFMPGRIRSYEVIDMEPIIIGIAGGVWLRKIDIYEQAQAVLWG